MITKKFTSVAQCITFMAIMAAINVIFVLLTTFVPFLLFLLVFVLPLSCTLVVLMCPKKYFLIYAFATIGLCLIVTIYNISDTLFYIVPSILTGFAFAICVEQKIPYSIAIMLATFIQFGLSYAAIPLIKLITHIDILLTIESAFNIEGIDNLLLFELSAVFIVSFMQEVVSFIVIRYGLQKMNYKIEERKDSILYLSFALLLNLFLSLLFVLLNWSVFIIFLMSAIYFGIFIAIWIICLQKTINYFILLGLSLVLIFVFAAVYSAFGMQAGLLVLIGYLFSLLIIFFINNFLVKNK